MFKNKKKKTRSHEVLARAKQMKEHNSKLREYKDYYGTNLLERAREIKGQIWTYDGHIGYFHKLNFDKRRVYFQLSIVGEENDLTFTINSAVDFVLLMNKMHVFDKNVREFISKSKFNWPKEAEKASKKQSEACAQMYLQTAVLLNKENHAEIYQSIKNVK